MAIRNRLTGLYADLLASNLVDQQTIIQIGNTVVGDQPERLYKYDSGSTATNNPPAVVAPTNGIGRYLLKANPYMEGAIALTTTGSGTATYANGGLNIPTPATGKRVETFLGSTDGSGNYTVTYGTAFGSTPDVQPQLQGGTVNQFVRITASSTTGFTVQATQRAVLSILGLDVLAGTATALASASVGVLVTER